MSGQCVLCGHIGPNGGLTCCDWMCWFQRAYAPVHRDIGSLQTAFNRASRQYAPWAVGRLEWRTDPNTNEPVLPGRFAAQVALHPGEATYSGRAATSPGAHGSGSSTTASRPVGLRSAGSNLVHTGMGGLGALENPNTISQQNPFATGIYSPFVLAPEDPTSALRNPHRAAFPTVLNQIGQEQQRPSSPVHEAVARLLNDPLILAQTSQDKVV